jgi:hypothetical protein
MEEAKEIYAPIEANLRGISDQARQVTAVPSTLLYTY